MSPQPKRLPRLWCALQGLLPFEACLAAQRGELAWPKEAAVSVAEGKEEEVTSNSQPPKNPLTVPWEPRPLDRNRVSAELQSSGGDPERAKKAGR